MTMELKWYIREYPFSKKIGSNKGIEDLGNT